MYGMQIIEPKGGFFPEAEIQEFSTQEEMDEARQWLLNHGGITGLEVLPDPKKPDLPKMRAKNRKRDVHYGAEFVFGCLEKSSIHHIRRIILRNGGVFREVYAYMGVYWTVAFLTPQDRDHCCQEIAAMENRDVDAIVAPKSDPTPYYVDPRSYADRYSVADRVRYFEIVNGIQSGPPKRRRPVNPLKGI